MSSWIILQVNAIPSHWCAREFSSMSLSSCHMQMWLQVWERLLECSRNSFLSLAFHWLAKMIEHPWKPCLEVSCTNTWQHRCHDPVFERTLRKVVPCAFCPKLSCYSEVSRCVAVPHFACRLWLCVRWSMAQIDVHGRSSWAFSGCVTLYRNTCWSQLFAQQHVPTDFHCYIYHCRTASFIASNNNLEYKPQVFVYRSRI